MLNFIIAVAPRKEMSDPPSLLLVARQHQHTRSYQRALKESSPHPALQNRAGE